MVLLTAQRPGEVLRLRWEEDRPRRGRWQLPDHLAKSGRGHRVPLSRLGDLIDAAARGEEERSNLLRLA